MNTTQAYVYMFSHKRADTNRTYTHKNSEVLQSESTIFQLQYLGEQMVSETGIIPCQNYLNKLAVLLLTSTI
jgi:hypothetical protein